MRKIVLLIVFYSFSFSFVFAQQHKIDSLFAVLKIEKDDTNKVNTEGALCSMLSRTSSYKAADSLGQKALELAIRLNFKTGETVLYRGIGSANYNRHNTSEALKNYLSAYSIDSAIGNKWGLGMDYACIGLVRAQQGNYDEALQNYKLALALLEATNNKDYIFRTYQFIGLLNKKRGNYPEALNYYLLSLKVAEETGAKQVAGDDYMDIGNIYIEQGNDSEAMRNYQLAIKRFDDIGNTKGVGNAYCNIGNLYNEKGKRKEALDYYNKSLKIAEETGDKEGMTNAYGNIGDMYEQLGDYKVALENHYKSLAIDQEIGDKEGVAEDYLNIGSILTNQKKYGEAKDCFDRSMALSKELKSKLLMKSSYEARFNLDTAVGNFRAGFYDYEKFITYRDSLKNEENTKKIVSEQMNYEFDKKQAVEKAEQDKKDAIASAEKRRQEIVTGAVSVGLLLVLIFSGLLFSRFRVTQKQKNIIEEQKALVEEKNKEVLDSITYAKRLQDAILPSLSVIKKYLPESFVLYKPKDIVAGDFYWMEKTGDTILIAAADCTGHGVPGAMVSVVCSNALNRTVKEFHITETGKILDKVRELVIETFEKSESEVKDGMDISLCSINRNTKEICWSGAYNPLWYMQNGELKELAADKQPIGKQENAKSFSTHVLNLQKGNMLYLFTDGYADQFGGPKGKKFKSKQLQEKLLAISSLDMNKQKEILDETIEAWKGDMEQTDDVCIIGIKV